MLQLAEVALRLMKGSNHDLIFESYSLAGSISGTYLEIKIKWATTSRIRDQEQRRGGCPEHIYFVDEVRNAFQTVVVRNQRRQCCDPPTRLLFSLVKNQVECVGGILPSVLLCLTQNARQLRVGNSLYVDVATRSTSNGAQESPRRKLYAPTVILACSLALPVSRKFPSKRRWGISAVLCSRQNARNARLFFFTSKNLKW